MGRPQAGQAHRRGQAAAAGRFEAEEGQSRAQAQAKP
jgi:hypothetical protein